MKTSIFSKQLFFIFLIIIITTFTLNCSCESVFEDEKFTLKKTPYNGKELRIDGYYFTVFVSTEVSNPPENTGITFLYNNGVALSTRYSEKFYIENSQNGQFYDKVKSNPNVWSLYSIEGDTIKIEYLKPMGGIGAPMYTKIGKIINDTTFQLIREYASYNINDSRELDEIFHFKQFAPKPDSTNVFIK